MNQHSRFPAVEYYESVQETIMVPDTFIFSKRHRLVNLVERVLKRFKMIEPYTVTKINFRQFQKDDLIELVKEQIILYKIVTGRHANKVIIGREQQKWLFNNMEPVHTTLHFSPKEKNRYLCGLEIEFHPLIDGVVVTTKL